MKRIDGKDGSIGDLATEGRMPLSPLLGGRITDIRYESDHQWFQIQIDVEAISGTQHCLEATGYWTDADIAVLHRMPAREKQLA